MATIDPSNPEVIGLEQQKSLAKALLQQGMNQNLQGQMVSGRFVGASPWEGIAKLANIYVGKSLGEEASKKEQELALKLRQQGVGEVSDILALAQGRPASQQELAGPAYQGVAPSVQYPAIEANTQSALAKALTGVSPQAQSLAPTLMQNLLPKKTEKLIEYDTYKAQGGKKDFSDWSKEITPEQQARLDIDRQRLGLEGQRFGLEQQKFAQEFENGKPLTESQGNATAFGMRMKESNQLINDLEKKGVTNTGVVRSTIGGIVGMTPFIGDKMQQGVQSGMNVFPGALGGPSAEQQQVDAARKNFITAVLRKESGAAISPTEFYTEAQKYFPQPGDAASVIKQKQNARETAIRAMEIQAGPGKRQIEQFSAPKKVVNFNDLP
jgi:hypothetical protein